MTDKKNSYKIANKLRKYRNKMKTYKINKVIKLKYKIDNKMGNKRNRMRNSNKINRRNINYNNEIKIIKNINNRKIIKNINNSKIIRNINNSKINKERYQIIIIKNIKIKIKDNQINIIHDPICIFIHISIIT